MSKTVQLQVPQPCHENWGKMSETDKGRFCLSCRKEVVDFSLMSDGQILAHISKASGSICGHFAAPQLNREITFKKERKLNWFKYVMHIIIPALLVTNRSAAQQVKIKGDTILAMPPKLFNDPVLIGTVGGLEIVRNAKHHRVIINGKVTDESGQGVPGCTIALKGTGTATSADGQGVFQLRISGEQKRVILVASSVGLEPTETPVDLNNVKKDTVIITMSMNRRIMTGEVVVCTAKKKMKTDTLQVVKHIINNIVGSESLKIYPNPVHAGYPFNIDFEVKYAGEYAVTVTGISGQVVLQKQVALNAGKHNEQVICDSRMAPGIYFAKVVHIASNKIYTNKILVE